MSNAQVNAIANAVLSGNPDLVKDLCSDTSVAITHLMLACRDFGNTNDLAQRCTKVPPNQRRDIFVDFLIEAAKSNAGNASKPEEAQEVVQEVVQEVEEPKAAPKRRRQPVQQPAQEVVETPAPRAQAEPDISARIDSIGGILSQVAQVIFELKDRHSALDEGISKDFASLNGKLDDALRKLANLNSKVEKFRAGTEALEIALIAKGLLDTAPFADSWGSDDEV
jgi:hypothetical protein